jgi:HlyD family secretion protein
VDLDKLYLKAYVPEKQIGQLRLGLPAQVTPTPSPARPSPPPSATSQPRRVHPKEVQTPTSGSS